MNVVFSCQQVLPTCLRSTSGLASGNQCSWCSTAWRGITAMLGAQCKLHLQAKYTLEHKKKHEDDSHQCNTPPLWGQRHNKSMWRLKTSAKASFNSFTLTSASLCSCASPAARWQLWHGDLPPPLVHQPCTASHSLSCVLYTH